MKHPIRHSYYEASARERIAQLLDAHSFQEICPPSLRLVSPHLAQLDAPQAFDDGLVIGAGLLNAQRVLIAAQEGGFNGGAVGEVHGAKLRGLLQRAVQEKPQAVLLLVDSGGVRLHEANAGLIAISEIMRAVMDVQAQGIPVLALVGGGCGAFGGMGIVTRLCHEVIMSDQGRLSLSGPEVIETVKGVAEFDARDRPLVWRVTGGKLRRSLGDATCLVDDDSAAFRQAAAHLIHQYAQHPPSAPTLEQLQDEHHRLKQRAQQFAHARDGLEVWSTLGIPNPQAVPLMSAQEFNTCLQEGKK